MRMGLAGRRIVNTLLVCALLGVSLSPAVNAQGAGFTLSIPLFSSADLTPVLLPVSNPDHAAVFQVSWQDALQYAVGYELQEASDAAFTQNVRQACLTAGLSCQVTAPGAGLWYYRVRGQNPLWGETGWSGSESVVVCGALAYNEPLLWNMAIIQAPAAWACSHGGQDVVIAVLDTGVYSAHPDLAGNLVAGASFVSYTTSWEDDLGHGTHVAGIAAGAANNGGILGVAPRAKIMPVKVCKADRTCDWVDIANGVYWAVDNGARVINLSLGDVTSSDTLRDALNYAYARNVVIAASAGNNGISVTNYPAAYTSTIAVAATTSADVRAYFSNMGNWLDVAAPGYFIFSSYYQPVGSYGYYNYMSGTSMAAPHVSGLAALVLALRPGWTPEQVRSLITSTAVDLGDAGYDTSYGWGRINAGAAINALVEAGTGSLAAPAAISPRSAAPPASAGSPQDYVLGEVLYKLRPGAAPADALPDGAQAGDVRSEAAIARAGIHKLHVPVGQEQA
ncbi:MAG: S8 family serine peptidase, partial [Anaerolineae bacterium]